MKNFKINETVIIKNLKPFEGQHCETTATGTLLKQIGIELSEPMLFGLGEGLGFIFWNMKSMSFPFIGGRIKPDKLTENITKNLGLVLTAKETSSPEKAWENAKEFIDEGQAVGLKLDSYYLEYFSKPFHFAGHYVALYGYDQDSAYLIDTKQQGGKVKTSLKSLAQARAAKGPMSSKNLYYTINKTHKKSDLKSAIPKAIKDNAIDYLNPPITNIGYKGILKTSSEIISWFKRSKTIETDFKTTAMLMEKAGTGGALFRNLYRDFLKESYEELGIEKLKMGYEQFAEIASLWTEVSALFEKTGNTLDFKHVQKASDTLKELSEKEKAVMEILKTI